MKEIVLYGIGVEGEKFYYLYRDKYKIICCVDKYRKGCFHNIPVYSPEKAYKYLKNYFVVIAAREKSYRQIKEVLDSYHLTEFQSYKRSTFLGKDLAILYGNCHMDILAEYLKNNPEFDRKFEIRIHHIYIDNEKNIRDEEINQCRLLIIQDIQNENFLKVDGKDEIINKFELNCQIIIVPNLFGCNLFWPQLRSGKVRERKRAWEKHIGENRIREIDDMYQLNIIRSMDYDDEYIESVFEKESVSEIVKSILENDLYRKDDILDNFKKQMMKIQEREKNCSIKIADYIWENYQNIQLFYEPTHPTNALIIEKGKRILKILGIPEFDCEIESKMDGYELIIYGCVRKALGLKFSQKYIRKHQKECTLHGYAMDITDYVEAYVNWILKD